MSKRFDFLRRGDEKPNGGFYWEQTGLVLIAKRSEEGEVRYYLKDQRSGELYSAFENKPREDKQQRQPQQRQPEPDKQQSDEFEDDIPF